MTTKPFSGHYVNKVVYVVLKKGDPAYKRVPRWITRRNGDRYYARAPKIGTLIREMDLQRDKDYGPERILPITARIYPSVGRSRKS